MARYIDAENIDFSPLKNDFEQARAQVIIMGHPTADVVEVKHGEWIYRDSDIGWKCYECSSCNTIHTFYDEDPLSNYCSHCGAKMDGRRDA